MTKRKKIASLDVVKQMISNNGILWTTYVVPYFLIRKVIRDCRIPFLDRRIKLLEAKYSLPGINSTQLNYAIWETWDWRKKAGDEWSPSTEWKQSVINDLILKYIPHGKSVLEIGPGAGRWTETLQQISRKLAIVDISPRCIQICKEKFSHCHNLSYFVTQGANLDFFPDETFDFVWSYDVFVHITPQDTEKYIREFQRILRKGGRGIIHHAKDGGLHGGWRSNMTDKLFARMLQKHNLTLVTQFDSWGENAQFDVKYYHDTITVFEKAKANA